MGIENSCFSDAQVLKNYVFVIWLVSEKYSLLDDWLLINYFSVMGIENSCIFDVQVLKNYVSVIWVSEKSPLLDDRLLINYVSVRWVFENMKFCKEGLKNLSCLIFEIIAFSRYWKILPKWYGV